jgi:hypothetical protein
VYVRKLTETAYSMSPPPFLPSPSLSSSLCLPTCWLISSMLPALPIGFMSMPLACHLPAYLCLHVIGLLLGGRLGAVHG